ncbi:hypothetical protein HW555_003226 [Spodoptera exigua]|uniref:Uncharacterized protein n=1 Tax=Spodoptera exigua TaxID=7107 RepID=A0A835GNY2_SPOEX|nr:hypothetical protein HW555_003226 [Spodoptera exigua]
MEMLKAKKDEFRCDDIRTERFFTENEEPRTSWFEIFCFPYTIFAKFWDFCMSVFAGTNQMLIFPIGCIVADLMDAVGT